MIKRSLEFYSYLNKRRSIRAFSSQSFPKEIIENIIKTAGTGPSGANKQPYVYVVVDDPFLKKQIRKAAEEEEKEFYDHKITEEWRKDLAHLGTDWHKPFLEDAPYLIVVFKQNYGYNSKTGKKSKHYYINESVGISIGILVIAIHNAGLCCLTHTPNPMNFIRKILNRPENEKPVVIIPVGYPAKNVKVPDIRRKSLDQILVWNRSE
jgi:nitroreductase